MGISLRIFIVNDDDNLQRLPLARYDRLIESAIFEAFFGKG